MRHSTFASLFGVTVSVNRNRFVQAACALRSFLHLTFERESARYRRQILGLLIEALNALWEPKSTAPLKQFC